MANSTNPATVNTLTALIKRLEAATTRLEDIATATEIPQAVPALNPNPSLGQTHLPNDPLAAASRLRQTAPDHVNEFATIIDTVVVNYVERSERMGGPVFEQAQQVLRGFREQQAFLLLASQVKQPEDHLFAKLLEPTNNAIMAVNSIRDTSRSSTFYNHLSTVAEGIVVLAWITLPAKPYKHVDDSRESAQYWGNRVLKEFKDKDNFHVEWVQSYYQIFQALHQYVKEHFMSGLCWNPQGHPAEDVESLNELVSVQSKATMSTSTTTVPPPPPPPPGPPPPPIISSSTDGGNTKGGLGAVFAQLNQGDNVTKGLRKVDRSEMTHKNPSIRTATSKDSGDGRGLAARIPTYNLHGVCARKQPKRDFEDNKWIIENYDKEPRTIEIDAELSHSILISNCNNTTIAIRGKGNAVTIENTTRLNLILDTLISSIDVIKSRNLGIQVLGTVPTILLDQVDGAQIYLSKEGSATRLFTSNATSVNLYVLSDNDGDYREHSLPSQICSYFDPSKGELVTEIVKHSG